MKIRGYLWAVATIFIFVHAARAQGPPILMNPPIMLSKGSILMRTRWELRQLEKGNTYLFMPLIMHYTLLPRIELGLHLPALMERGQAESSQETRFGNIAFLGKYQLLRKDGKQKTFRIATKTLWELPNGIGKGPMDFDAQEHKITCTQLIGYESLRYGIVTELGYRAIRNHPGDEIIFNIVTSLPLLPHRYPVRQINLYLSYFSYYRPQLRRYAVQHGQGIQYAHGRWTLDLAFKRYLWVRESDRERIRLSSFLGTRYVLY
ncbi:MAG: hypothetical protein OXB93_06210 [Cytophagales bacterium]|nr:hypothetical protein [Cytophagales bacterium]